MVTQKETNLRKRWIEKIEKIHGVHLFRVEQESLRGFPDQIGICGGGVLLAIEDKRDEKQKPRGAQSFYLQILKALGGIATIGDDETYAELLELLLADRRCETCNRLIVPWSIGRVR